MVNLNQFISLLFILILCILNEYKSTLLQVQIVTRHGNRAPDNVVAKELCKPLFPNGKKDIVKKFGVPGGRLTERGISQMQEIGNYIRERYVSGEHFEPEHKWLSNRGFVSPKYVMDEWDFEARAGFRQQQSLMAISLGIYPNQAVPINVKARLEDSILGGPAPACGNYTAPMIVNWHKTKGREIIDSKPIRDGIISKIEKICNTSFAGNPVNAKPGGPNPHDGTGDILDLADTMWSNGIKNNPFEDDRELHEAIKKLGFKLEQESHYEDPKGAIYFAGEFPNNLLSNFELFDEIKDRNKHGIRKTPKKQPKMKLYLCSRELLYGLEHMFDWQVQLTNQPPGRVVAGTSFIFELHEEQDRYHPGYYGLMVRSYYYSPGMEVAKQLMPDIGLRELREKYESYIHNNGGPWYKICDFQHFNSEENLHDPNYINPEYEARFSQRHEYDGNANKDKEQEESIINQINTNLTNNEQILREPQIPITDSSPNSFITTFFAFVTVMTIIGVSYYAYTKNVYRNAYQQI